MRGIAKRVDCAASTISRELRRNGEPERYRELWSKVVYGLRAEAKG
jgi:IS30 family transposase